MIWTSFIAVVFFTSFTTGAAVEKTCPMYPPPYNGALACYHFGSDLACTVQCKEGFHFTSEPPFLYLCNSGVWAFVGSGFGYTMPWPNCSAQAVQARNLDFNPYYFFSGDANDPNVIQSIKTGFLSLLQSFSQCPGGCESDNVQVLAGEVSS